MRNMPHTRTKPQRTLPSAIKANRNGQLKENGTIRIHWAENPADRNGQIMTQNVFRTPQEVFAEIDYSNKQINQINYEINQLCRKRRTFENSVDNCRSELKAMAEPDGHLPNCSRSDRCLGNGWCRP